MTSTKQEKLKAGIFMLVAVHLSITPLKASDKHGPGPTETESKLWLVGDSSLHAYSSTAHAWTIDFGVAGDAPLFDRLKTGQLKTLEVAVPVKEMRSGKDGLDKNMQKALKSDENPNIFFHLGAYKVTPSTIPSQGMAVSATGMLEIAGVKKEVMLEATLTIDNSGGRIQGVENLLMTDYGIKPPKILLIKTANEISVHYDLRVDEKGRLK